MTPHTFIVYVEEDEEEEKDDEEDVFVVSGMPSSFDFFNAPSLGIYSERSPCILKVVICCYVSYRG